MMYPEPIQREFLEKLAGRVGSVGWEGSVYFDRTRGRLVLKCVPKWYLALVMTYYWYFDKTEPLVCSIRFYPTSGGRSTDFEPLVTFDLRDPNCEDKLVQLLVDARN